MLLPAVSASAVAAAGATVLAWSKRQHSACVVSSIIIAVVCTFTVSLCRCAAKTAALYSTACWGLMQTSLFA